MAKPSQSRFLFRCFNSITSKTSTSRNPTGTGISHFITDKHTVIRNPSCSSSWLFNSQRTHVSSSVDIQGVVGKFNPLANLLRPRNTLGFRYYSLSSHGMGPRSFVMKLVEKPAFAIKNVFARSKEAVGLQIEAFWRRNYLAVLGAGGLAACILLWRVLFGIANIFVSLSEGMAKYGFLALSSAIVAFAGLYLRSRYTINPDKVYRMTMTKLNTSAGILEVMGAPLSGTDLRAYVMSGGGISLKNFRPSLRSKRCFLIFPVHGSERKGLVSVEVKKKQGQYDMKLLAVDIPMARGPDQRLFLIGDEEEYKIGGGLISELRDPVVKALAAAKEFEERDLKEDEEDEVRELEEEAARQREESEKLEISNSQ